MPRCKSLRGICADVAKEEREIEIVVQQPIPLTEGEEIVVQRSDHRDVIAIDIDVTNVDVHGTELGHLHTNWILPGCSGDMTEPQTDAAGDEANMFLDAVAVRQWKSSPKVGSHKSPLLPGRASGSPGDGICGNQWLAEAHLAPAAAGFVAVHPSADPHRVAGLPQAPAADGPHVLGASAGPERPEPPREEALWQRLAHQVAVHEAL